MNSNGEMIALFAWGSKANVPEYMVKNDTTYRFITDPRGSVRLVVNVSDGNIIQRINYDEWGKVTLDTNPGFQPFGYAGGLYDHRTGLTEFGARHYSAEVGKWISKDPIGFAGGDSNLYAYVGGNPINHVDPSGLYWFRQDWQEPGVVGREHSPIVPPRGTISQYVEQYVLAGYTFGEQHDAFVDWTVKELGMPDLIANIPSMPFAYISAVTTEVLRSVGVLGQPTPSNVGIPNRGKMPGKEPMQCY